jgi:hypothetical protein
MRKARVVLTLALVGVSMSLAADASATAVSPQVQIKVVPLAPAVGQVVVVAVHVRGLGRERVARAAVSYGDGQKVSIARLPSRLTHRYRRAGTFRLNIALAIRGHRPLRAAIVLKVRARSHAGALPSPATVPVVCEVDPNPDFMIATATDLYELAGGRLHRFARYGPYVPGWHGPSVGLSAPFGCGSRRQWSADFSKYLFSGIPVGGNVAHIGVYDIRSGHVTDLTAIRQGSGFSAPNLEEERPEFLGPGGPAIVYGSDDIVFRRAEQAYETSLSNPSQEVPIAETSHDAYAAPELDVFGNHYEQEISGGRTFGLNGAALANPNGTLVAATKTFDGPIAWAAADPGDLHDIKCFERHEGGVLGWRDSSHLVVAEVEGFQNNLAAGDVALATIATDGSLVSCKRILPPTEKRIANPYLSLDETRVLFTLENVAGPEPYGVSIEGEGVSNPVPTTPELNLETAKIFDPIVP